MVKVSVIIPIYNCESYIEQCISSVQNQTLKELEIVCVDDGSTDTSADIVTKMAECDKRIYLYKQSNQGAGIARNHGMQKARGKYLAFLDADDYYLDTDALEKMVTLCEKKGVSVCGSFLKCLDNGKEKVDSLLQKMWMRREDSTGGIIYKYSDFQIDYEYTSFVFSKKLIQDNNIVFPNYRRFQDPPFMVQAMWHAQEFAIEDTYLYCYRKPEMAARFTEAKTADLIRGLIDNLKFADAHGLETLFSVTRQRLEYEYAGIIYHNISSSGGNILHLLSQANQIINQKSGDSGYVIRPLRWYQEQGAYQPEAYETKLLEHLKSEGGVALYGAGKYAKAFLQYLENHGLKEKVKIIVVSALSDNEAYLQEIPLISVKDFSDKKNRGKVKRILVTLGGHFHKEIEDILKAEKIENYQFIDDVFLSELC